MEKKPIKLKLGSRTADTGKVDEFIKHLYDTYPINPMNPEQFAMLYGSGEDQQIAVFDIRQSRARPNVAVVHWVHTYPHRQGVGTRAFGELKAIASRYGVGLELYPWQHGRVSQSALTKFYKKQGFKPINKGGKDMIWQPTGEVDEANSLRYIKDYDPSDEFYDPDERIKTKNKAQKKKADDVEHALEHGISVWVPSWKALFYISAHILQRGKERNIPMQNVISEISRLFEKHKEKILTLPADSKFVLRTPYRYSIVMSKEPLGNDKTRYAAVTVLPLGDPIPRTAKFVFAESDE